MTIISKAFVANIKKVIKHAQYSVVRAVNQACVHMYWQIGRHIDEEEQHGKERAEYGSYLIKSLAKELEKDFGSEFSYCQLNFCRQFHLTFPIVNTLRLQFNWSQYKLLIRIEDEDKRAYYIEETCNNNWSSRQLERQINSQLYECLLMSNDKEKVLAVAKKEAKPDHPKEIIKDPMVLEFLGLRSQSNYFEKDLESAIISKLC